MKLQELIDQTELDMTETQIKAFFLGVLCAVKPLPFPKALDELLVEAPEAKKDLEAELKKLWDHLKLNTKAELEKIFPESSNINVFMEVAKEQLDFFLTAMSLSGTNAESCNDEDLVEHIEEFEDMIADLDEYLSDSEATSEDGADFKEYLLGTWSDFIVTRK